MNELVGVLPITWAAISHPSHLGDGHWLDPPAACGGAEISPLQDWEIYCCQQESPGVIPSLKPQLHLAVSPAVSSGTSWPNKMTARWLAVGLMEIDAVNTPLYQVMPAGVLATLVNQLLAATALSHAEPPSYALR